PRQRRGRKRRRAASRPWTPTTEEPDRMMKSMKRGSLLPLMIGLLACGGAGHTPGAAAAEGAVTAAASMSVARSGHTATLLPSGDVLIAGGMNGNDNYFAGCEVYSPASNRFTAAAAMSTRRIGH